VWFVAYFATGMVLTYTHNAVAASWQAIILNVGAFGIAAIAMEYVRHTIMLLINRRDGVWFGLIVAVVFAIEQIGLVQILGLTDGIGIVKFTVATIMPALVSSALLTYLAFNVGFSAQLTYRLGIVAVLYVPPIIPKYDWYVIGIAWLVLALSVYLVIDHTRREVAINGRHYRHARRATNSMFVIAMTGLVCFMTGVFSYQPQVIMSNSMVPVFSRGAMVIVEKVDAMDVRVGDIIQYKTTERMITHRVIEIDTTDDGTGERVYITQGDNSPNPDEKPVQLAQVVGIIRAQIPYVGYPTVWLREIMK
jgi:signal peptidase